MQQQKSLSRLVVSMLLVCAVLLGLTLAPQMTALAAPGDDIAPSVQWNYVAFGQSVDLDFTLATNAPGQKGINNVWVNPDWLGLAGDPATRGTFVQSPEQIAAALKNGVPYNYQAGDKIVLESRGGKIATGHDGITFLYTKLPTNKNYVLTAKVTKLFMGAYGSDGTTNVSQSGGGMMARDSIGPHRADPFQNGYQEPPSASNFAGVGANGANNGSMVRDGCLPPNSAVGVAAPTARNTFTQATGTALVYKLERKNDGFYMTVYAADGTTVVRAETRFTANWDLVMRIDENNMYWGFFAARQARILVEDVTLRETGDATNTVRTRPPAGKAWPASSVVTKSRANTGLPAYTLALLPNYKGTMTINYGGSAIFSGPVQDYEEVRVDVTLSAGTNTFSYSYTPAVGDPNDGYADASLPNTTAARTGDVSVTLDTSKASAAWDVIWAGAEAAGTGTGQTKENRTTIANAIGIVEPGQTIDVVDGNYAGATLTVGGIAGTLAKRAKIQPEPGVASIKFSSINITGSYWHVQGFIGGGTAANRSGRVSQSGDFNILEQIVGEYSASSFSIGGGGDTAPQKSWPRGNLVLNCTARYNLDSTLENADGFDAKRVGPGNVFRGCIAHHNTDDGYDFFTWVTSGPSATITVENCVAYANGHNGFKLGGEAQLNDHVVRNCLAFANVMANFSDNFNPGDLRLNNCTSLDALDQNIILRSNPLVQAQNKLTDSLSLRTPFTTATTYWGKDDAVSGTLTRSALNVGGVTKIDGYTVTAGDFVSLAVPAFYAHSDTAGLNGVDVRALCDSNPGEFYQRDGNGDIVWGSFLRPKYSSPISRAGTNGSYLGALAPAPGHTVTLDPNGGAFPGGGTASQTLYVDQNDTLAALPAPVPHPARDGFTFLYWTLDGAEFDLNTPITAAIALKAAWAEITIQPPLKADGTSRFKLGSTVPVKFELLYGDTPISNAVAGLYVAQKSSTPDAGTLEPISTAAATTGNLFRYDADAGQYVFNLSTKAGYTNPGEAAPVPFTEGSWLLTIRLADGSSRSVEIQLAN